MFYTLVRLSDQIVLRSLESEEEINSILVELHGDGADLHDYDIIQTDKLYQEDQVLDETYA
jgi:hypothetical protein